MENNSKSLTYQDYVKGVQKLKPKQQLRLLRIITDTLQKKVQGKQKKHRLMDLAGLGSEIWRGVDTDAYLREERESWD